MNSIRIALLALALSACSTGRKAATAETRSINVLTYNIHHANPPSVKDKIDIPAVAKVINAVQPDLVALQEIDVYTTRSGKTLHQAEALGKASGMHVFFAKGIDFGGGEYGIAILSRYPILETKRYPLTTIPGTNGEPRALATVLVALPDNRRLLMACTHLDAQRSDSNRLVQIREIMNTLQQQPHPVILAGDLNAAVGSGVIRTLDEHLTRSCERCAPTIPMDHPRECIDFISFSKEKFMVEKHAVIDEKYASDHLPVNAVLRLK